MRIRRQALTLRLVLFETRGVYPGFCNSQPFCNMASRFVARFTVRIRNDLEGFAVSVILTAHFHVTSANAMALSLAISSRLENLPDKLRALVLYSSAAQTIYP